MRMSDVMSNLGLAIYPIVGMLLFLSVFVWVVIRVLSRSRCVELDNAALLPLADDRTHAFPVPATLPSETRR